MKYISRRFRKENSFVLYDMNDNIICYFDNFEELSKHLNYRCNDLVRQFNIYGDLIVIRIEGIMYKLYTVNLLETRI